MKVTKTFTIDEMIYKKFSYVAKNNSINKSQFIENCMLDYIKNIKNNDTKNVNN